MLEPERDREVGHLQRDFDLGRGHPWNDELRDRKLRTGRVIIDSEQLHRVWISNDPQSHCCLVGVVETDFVQSRVATDDVVVGPVRAVRVELHQHPLALLDVPNVLQTPRKEQEPT